MYDAEKQIVKALPNVIEAASSSELREALESHLEETKEQVRRLEEISNELGVNFNSTHSEVMASLLKEADKTIEEDYETSVKDAALINCAQHVKHFEIASYGILKSLAKHLEHKKVLQLLEKSSKEEGNANKTLNKIADGSKGVNKQALKRKAA